MCTSEAMGPVSMSAQRRGWEGESADVHTGEAAGHAHMMNSRALSVGARRPGKGRVGRAVCTSEAMGACDVGCAREGLGGRMRRCAYRKGC